MINWIMQRAKEPSSYAAVGVGIVGLGVISGVGELIFIVFFKKNCWDSPQTIYESKCLKV